VEKGGNELRYQVLSKQTKRLTYFYPAIFICYSFKTSNLVATIFQGPKTKVFFQIIKFSNAKFQGKWVEI
jgi:hypothetical protein